MRLLLVTHYYSTHRGGVEIVAGTLATLLGSAGFGVDWLASDCDPAPPAAKGVRCVPMASWNGIERASGIPYPLWAPRSLGRLRQAVCECDAVHLHDALYMGSAAAFAFARRERKPVLVTQHAGDPAGGGLVSPLVSFLNRTLARSVLARADQVFFVSPAVQAYFSAFVPFRAPPRHVANGVDAGVFAFADAERSRALRAAAGRDPRRPLCLFVGRFIESKGLRLLLALARAFPETDWIFAGHGPLPLEEERLPNAAVVRGASGEAIAALYRMADLVLLPSRREGFPLVIQEALACGTPVLVSEEAAAGSPAMVPLMFVESVRGADALARWRTRLAALLAQRGELDAMRGRLAEAARREWSWARTADLYGVTLRRLVEKPPLSG